MNIPCGLLPILLILMLALSACEDVLKGSVQAEKGPLLSFDQTDYTFAENDQVQMTASVRGTVNNCSVEPALPFGLTIDPRTCSISGMALSLQSKTHYIVSFTNQYGESIPRQISLSVVNYLSPQMIAMGEIHSCALKTSGDVYCWGDNSSGQLGDGTNISSLTPVKVINLSGVKKIVSFTRSNCALLSDQTLKCWGNNAQSQLGDATIISRNSPVVVAGISGVLDVRMGDSHTCVLLADHSVRCWGYNANGELGQGYTSSNIAIPVTPIGFSTGVRTLVTGAFQTCAIFNDGTAKCTGFNHMGQVGVGYAGTVTTPSLVNGLSAGVKSMALGREHACAALENDRVYCWGEGSSGQIGNGGFSYTYTPMQVTGLTGVVSLSAGRNTTCALNSYGIVKCWGANYYGKVGNGNTTDQSTPQQVSPLINISKIVSGYEGSCAIRDNLETYCWGWNDYGQLGDGTVNPHTSPVQLLNPFAE